MGNAPWEALAGSPETEPRIELPAGSPDDLLAIAHQSSLDARELVDQPTRPEFADVRAEQIRLKIYTGLQAADKAAAHAEAGDDHRAAAERERLSLLYLGAKKVPTAFEQRLREHVEQIAGDKPDSHEAALAKATWLEVDAISKLLPADVVMQRLDQFAAEHPDNPAGLRLYQIQAAQLENTGQRDKAIAFYRRASELYDSLPQVETLRRRLAQLDASVQLQAAARESRQQAETDELSRIVAGLGGARDGYFVIYAEEQVDKPQQGLIAFYQYDYVVRDGQQAAIEYVRSLAPKWTWKLAAHFPDTPAGRDQAYATLDKLKQQKRTGRKD